ncbi:hypothetical protein ASG01_07555 [Chryseobacterium sp. Leaf180]|nr:hypothetical protein ASG01_07555 [Chryseobacterium sp. Leaf180]
MDAIHDRQFEKVKKGMNISECRNILGEPDESKIFDNYIMDVYYYFPMAEARFFYSQKDRKLRTTWRTDCD